MEVLAFLLLYQVRGFRWKDTLFTSPGVVAVLNIMHSMLVANNGNVELDSVHDVSLLMDG